MTIKEFYDWAVEKGIENFDIVINDNGYWYAYKENIEIDKDCSEVKIIYPYQFL